MSTSSSDGAATYLVCESNGRLYALPVAHVVETMRPLPVTAFASAPSFISGIALIRGAPVPVVDVAILLGASASAPKRYVIVRTPAGHVAVAVDAVREVRAISPESLHAAPPLLADVGSEGVDALATLDSDLLVLLRSARLVPETVWDALASPRVAP